MQFYCFIAICQLITEAVGMVKKKKMKNLIPYSYLNSTVQNATYLDAFVVSC